MRIGRTVIAIAGAAVLLVALATAASARSFSTSSQTLRATFANVEFGGGFGTTTCNITMEGSFHERTIQKVVGTLSGFITRVIIGNPCRVGSATVLSETLPWHVRYAGFTGSLPNIATVRANIVGAAYRVLEPIFEFECLARSTEANPVTVVFNREAGGVLTTALLGGVIPTSCGGNGTLRGTSTTFTVLNSSTRITLTLI